MKKPFIASILCVLFILPAVAQKNDPNIPSGQWLEQAGTLYDSSQYKQAIALYRHINRNDTNYVRACYGISESFYQDSQFDAALEAAKEGLASISTDPEREPQLLNHYGNILNAMEKYQEALHWFDSAIRKYPAYSVFYVNKGTSLIDLNRLSEAEAVFKEALLLDPYSYSSHFKLGFCAVQQGKLIPGMLSFLGYLLMAPEGRFRTNCIQYLNSIAHNEDTIQVLIAKRKEDPDANYQLLEQILQSKIALDKNYKPICKLDDPITRQIQVVFEKMQYDAADSDFWMQYYIPYFKSVYADNKYELFVNRVFSSINIPAIQDFLKQNEKQLLQFRKAIPDYFDMIQATRDLTYSRRDTDSLLYIFSHGEISGHGVYIAKKDQLHGPWEFYYGSGNLKAKGSYNAEGHKEGRWNFYYYNGRLKETGDYRNGKVEGEDKAWFSNGQVSSISQYKDGKLEGISTGYFWVGLPRVITHYHEDKEEGEKLSFNSDGDTSMLEHYHAGMRDGELRTWSKYGTPEVICNYKSDKLDGDYKKYYANGQLLQAGVYKAGKQEGEWKTWFASGQLKTVSNFVNDNSEGEYKEYYSNGVQFAGYTTKKGKINGEARYFDEDGKLYVIYTYSNGILQKTQNFDKTGAKIAEASREQKAIALVQYLPDGSKSSQAHYSDNGDLQGTKTLFFPSGKVLETEEFKDGTPQGPRITYFGSGQKKIENNYVDGKKDGHHLVWYAHGQLQEEGWYSADDAQDNWVFYNELGNLTDSISYSDGIYNGYKTSFNPNGKRQSEYKYHGGWIEEWAQYDTTGKELRRLRFPNGTGHVELIYPNGKVLCTAEYKQSQLVGPYLSYYFDGKPMTDAFYVKGRLHGAYKTWFHIGQVNSEGQYAFGEKTGVWKYYYNTGILRQQENFVRGDREGEQLMYFRNGKLQSSIPYKEGNREGWAKFFDPMGNLQYTVKYHDDDPIAWSYRNARDSLLPEIPIVRKAAKIKAFFPNGKVSAEMEYQDGLLTGEQRLYYSTGQLLSVIRREEGNYEGEFTMYHPNGKVLMNAPYLHDNIHGAYKEYNDKGILISDWNYYCDNPHGITKIYDDNGRLLESDVYYYGNLISI